MVFARFYPYSKYNRLHSMSVQAIVVMTSSGLKAYATYTVNGHKEGLGEGTTYYEFDFEQGTLRKITDLSGFGAFSTNIIPAIGVYTVKDKDGKIKYYSIATGKYLYSGGHLSRYNYAGTYTEKLKYGSYIMYVPNGARTGGVEYSIASDGSRTPLRIASKYYLIKKGDRVEFKAAGGLIQYDTVKDGPLGIGKDAIESISWIKDGNTNLLLKGKGIRIRWFISPSERYMLIVEKKDTSALEKGYQNIHIYDFSKKKMVSKIKAHYTSYILSADWATEELLLLRYQTSNPGKYPPYYFHIPTSHSIPLRDIDSIYYLSSADFSPDEIRSIYHMRWGIETSFRALKYTVGLTNFHAKKQESITQEIFARMILYNFAEMMTSTSSFPKWINGIPTKLTSRLPFTFVDTSCALEAMDPCPMLKH